MGPGLQLVVVGPGLQQVVGLSSQKLAILSVFLRSFNSTHHCYIHLTLDLPTHFHALLLFVLGLVLPRLDGTFNGYCFNSSSEAGRFLHHVLLFLFILFLTVFDALPVKCIPIFTLLVGNGDGPFLALTVYMAVALSEALVYGCH